MAALSKPEEAALLFLQLNPNLCRLELQIPFVDTGLAKILVLSADLVLLRTVPLACVIRVRVSRLLPVRV